MSVCGRTVDGGPDGAKLGRIETLDHSDLARAWRASPREIRPTDGVLVERTRGRSARPHAGPTRRLDVVRWGLVPRWWARPLRELGDIWNARSGRWARGRASRLRGAAGDAAWYSCPPQSSFRRTRRAHGQSDRARPREWAEGRRELGWPPPAEVLLLAGAIGAIDPGV